MCVSVSVCVYIPAGKAGSDGKTEWTVHDVELALWAFYFAKKLKPELLQRKQTQISVATSKDRKRTSNTEGSDYSGSEEETPTKSKRFKHS